jgi:hypothetical protein
LLEFRFSGSVTAQYSETSPEIGSKERRRRLLRMDDGLSTAYPSTTRQEDRFAVPGRLARKQLMELLQRALWKAYPC